ncbi:MAG TPA: UxaA family hydrolase, partial [Streptosporangiaceae bacterium]
MTVSSAAARGIRLQADDDVAITTADVAAGTPVDVGGGLVTVRQDVSRGHKLAVRDLAAGAPVHRYGQVIGFTRGPVAAGEHVHLHNLE